MTLFRDQGILLGKVDIGGRVYPVATECGCRILVPASTDELRLYPCATHISAFNPPLPRRSRFPAWLQQIRNSLERFRGTPEVNP